MESETRTSPEKLAVLVVGTDTLIETLPARPIQLAHACGALGFDLIVPLSWGDELVAEAALRHLERRPPSPAVFCACPLVRQRLLQAGKDLTAAMVSIAPSPVALARHLRTTMGLRLASLSFVGRCPSAIPPAYDVTYDPAALLGMLRDRGIRIQEQPDVFSDILPPDRSRFVSLPGGCPTPDVLWQRCNERMLVEIEGPDLPLEIAQHLVSSQSILVDVATSLGCHCCGVTPSTADFSVRVAVSSMEPPRSTTPIVNDAVVSELDLSASDAAKSFGYNVFGASRRSERARMAVTPASALRVRG